MHKNERSAVSSKLKKCDLIPVQIGVLKMVIFSSFKGLFGRCQDIFAYFCSEEVCIQIKIPFALKETVGLHYDTVSPKLILTHL